MKKIAITVLLILFLLTGSLILKSYATSASENSEDIADEITTEGTDKQENTILTTIVVRTPTDEEILAERKRIYEKYYKKLPKTGIEENKEANILAIVGGTAFFGIAALMIVSVIHNNKEEK